MASLASRARSLRHRVALALSERIRWSRGPYREVPAGELEGLTAMRAARIAALRERHGVAFERRLGAATSLRNYEYLDLLDCAAAAGVPLGRAGGALCDVGCASFGYAAALHAFFRPERLLGVDVEGYRLLRDGRSRIDHARGYLADLPGARFVVADYADMHEPADVITAWFPFVTEEALLAWRLPLSLLAPGRLFGRIRANLAAGGSFVMVNHGRAEALAAFAWCDAVGLIRQGDWSGVGAFGGYRTLPPVVSVWRAG